jgi:hypothetical protein
MGILTAFIAHHLRLSARRNEPPAAVCPEDLQSKPSRDAHTGEGQILEWVNRGLPAPPPHVVKQAVVRAFADRYGIRILVETGTYFGDMVDAMKERFERVYSIELSAELFRRAAARFRDERNVTLIQGDSGQAIEQVLTELREPALFWLDGHWSSGVTARGDRDTPVRQELDAIFASDELPHVILIDDARHFGTEADYPSIEALRQLTLAKRPRFEFGVDVDIIRISPPHHHNDQSTHKPD